MCLNTENSVNLVTQYIYLMWYKQLLSYQSLYKNSNCQH